MAADERETPLDERLDRLFIEVLLERLEDRRELSFIAIACLGVRIWQLGRSVNHFVAALFDRPEIEYLVELGMNAAVTLAFSYFLQAFSRELVTTVPDESLIVTFGDGLIFRFLELLYWGPPILLFVYQTHRFVCGLLRR